MNSEFRQGALELRMWPSKMADGSTRTTTPGIFSDIKESELEEAFGHTNGFDDHHSNMSSNSNAKPTIDEFPILDELDRLAKMSKYHSEGHMIKQDWLDRLTLKEIQNAVKREKQNLPNTKFFFMTIEFAQIKCEDVKYVVLYYEEVKFKQKQMYLFNLVKFNVKSKTFIECGKDYANFANERALCSERSRTGARQHNRIENEKARALEADRHARCKFEARH